MALALAGVMAASALTGCEKIEDTKAASGNTTAAKAADEGKAGEQPGAGETQKEAAGDKAGENAAGEMQLEEMQRLPRRSSGPWTRDCMRMNPQMNCIRRHWTRRAGR